MGLCDGEIGGMNSEHSYIGLVHSLEKTWSFIRRTCTGAQSMRLSDVALKSQIAMHGSSASQRRQHESNAMAPTYPLLRGLLCISAVSRKHEISISVTALEE